MNEIGCELCMDLIPLVRDGVAGEESRRAVERHVAECEVCRAYLAEEAAPSEVPEEKALSRAVKRVRRLSAVAAVVFILMGICLCELVFRGSSVVFLVFMLLIWRLGRAAAEKGQSRGKRWAALIAAVALTAGLCAMGNAVAGNPFSRMLAESAAENYLAGKFPEGGYEVANIWFDSKRGHYGIVVQKSGSQDVRFTVDTDMKGNFHHDTYDDVLTGWNTAHRLEGEYQILVEPVLHRLNLTFSRAYASCALEFEHRQWGDDPYAFQYFLNGEALVPDGEYDMATLGAMAGHLSVTVEESEVSAEKAAQILLEIRCLMDEAGVPFHSVDLTLKFPQPEDPMQRRQEGTVEVADFPYEEIYEEGLADRVREANLSASLLP